MQLNVIMAILLTNSNIFQKEIAIGFISCNAERKNYNALFCGNKVPHLPRFWTNVAKHTPITTIYGDANGVKWQ